MVTVELAVGFLVAVAMTTALVGASLLGVAQATAAEASAQLARQAARGDDDAFAEARGRVPDGARIEVDRQAGGVEARVTLSVPVLKLGVVDVSAMAWAAYEPGVGP
ncbi:TadE family type IV pilus minor pilin [Tessaracoccus lubricantis]